MSKPHQYRYIILSAKPPSYEEKIETTRDYNHILTYARAYFDYDAKGREEAATALERMKDSARIYKYSYTDLIISSTIYKYLGDDRFELAEVSPGFYRVLDYKNTYQVRTLLAALYTIPYQPPRHRYDQFISHKIRKATHPNPKKRKRIIVKRLIIRVEYIGEEEEL